MTRRGATINVFMLADEEPALVRFVERGRPAQRRPGLLARRRAPRRVRRQRLPPGPPRPPPLGLTPRIRQAPYARVGLPTSEEGATMPRTRRLALVGTMAAAIAAGSVAAAAPGVRRPPSDLPDGLPLRLPRPAGDHPPLRLLQLRRQVQRQLLPGRDHGQQPGRGRQQLQQRRVREPLLPERRLHQRPGLLRQPRPRDPQRRCRAPAEPGQLADRWPATSISCY